MHSLRIEALHLLFHMAGLALITLMDKYLV